MVKQSTTHLGMVYTNYKNGDDWGMVQMALLYPHSSGRTEHINKLKPSTSYNQLLGGAKVLGQPKEDGVK
jgi:hypothetical protein